MTMQTHPSVVEAFTSSAQQAFGKSPSPFNTETARSLCYEKPLQRWGCSCAVTSDSVARRVFCYSSTPLPYSAPSRRAVPPRDGSTSSAGLLPPYRRACSPGDFLRGSGQISIRRTGLHGPSTGHEHIPDLGLCKAFHKEGLHGGPAGVPRLARRSQPSPDSQRSPVFRPCPHTVRARYLSLQP